MVNGHISRESEPVSRPLGKARGRTVMVIRAHGPRILAGVLLLWLLGGNGSPLRAAATPEKIPQLDSLEIVVVVDNFYDFFQKEEKCAKRLTLAAADSFE